jgi:hypothetical protein
MTAYPRCAASEVMIQALWGMGLTIVPRAPADKVFDLANGLAPRGMTYQWNDDRQAKGWECVPAERHPGLFAPWGHIGPIEVNRLWLMERPKAEVDAFHAEAHRKARQNVDDWYSNVVVDGFTGGVTILMEGSGGRSSDIREVGDKTLEDATKIPRELTPYIGQIFEVRDRLWESSDQWWGKPTPEFSRYTELAQENPEWTRGQLMNAVLTPIAIEQTRKYYLATEGTQHDESTGSIQPVEGDAGQDRTGERAADAPTPGTPPDAA